MKKEFDWNKFKTENIAVHCKTQKEADMFFNKMNMLDIAIVYVTAKKNNYYWDDYKENTCYSVKPNGYWEFCFKRYYEDYDYTVLEFSDYFDVDELSSHYGEIKFNGDCFIVKERDECNNSEWMYLCDLFGLDYDATERIVIDGIVKYFGLRKDEV